MVELGELVEYLNGLLQVERFRDYAPNGLQVEGRTRIRRIVSGVSASLELIQAAVATDADCVLVHHGYFWKSEDPCVRGMKRRRLRLLLGNDIGLLAYHLPLDAHPELGNNAQLARLLGLKTGGALPAGMEPALALHGRLAVAMTPGELARHLSARLGRDPLHIPGGPEVIRTVGWCTGAAQDYIDQAAAAGLDAYISGEISERTTHSARESGIHYYAAGHHATERGGVVALGAHLSERFGLEHQFIEIDNPV